MSLYFVYENHAEEFREWLHKPGGHEIIAIDIEGDNLESPHQNRVRTVQFGDENVGWNLPLVDLPSSNLLSRNRGLVRGALEHLRGTPKVLHNESYDIPQLMHHVPVAEWDWEHTDDTMQAAQIHWPDRSAALKSLNETFIQAGSAAGSKKLERFMRKGYPCPEHATEGRCKVCNGRRRVPYTWADVPVDAYEYWAYGALDTVLTARLWKYMNERDMFDHEAYKNKLLLTEMTVTMSQRGLKIDRQYCEQQRIKCITDTAQLGKDLQEKYGLTSLNSGPQVAKVLVSLGAELTEKTEKGGIKVDKGVLKGLEGPPELMKFIDELLYYKKRKKDQGYFERFLQYADDNDLIHAQINPNAARTGRMSISKPSLQNLTASNAVVRNAVIPG